MKLPASQFYWADWMRDPAVRACSLEERGFWIDLLALMHAGEPRGHLTVGGHPPTEAELARMVGTTPPAAKRLLASLGRKGVYSRTEAGVIFSRRMVRDEQIRQVRKAAGKLGGNPNLMDKGEDKQEVKGLVNQTDKQNPTPSVAVAVAVSSALPTTTATTAIADASPNDTEKSSAPKPDALNWVSEVGDAWTAAIGFVDYGLVGKQLKQPHRVFGLDALLAAVGKFAEHRQRQVSAGNDRPDGWPQFVRDLRDHIPPAFLRRAKAATNAKGEAA